MRVKHVVQIVILALLIALALYIRLAPSDADRWHRMPEAVTDRDLTGGAMRVVHADAESFRRLHEIITGAPRTRVLAGSVEERMVTYVTRSLVWGFPDYTTIRLRGERIEVYARLRFGNSDFGVNAERVDRWLARLAQRR
ncbi:DUF1499 domain-containing protein [Roseovarius salinarum]|uniref:DUF1499 domain-containing protein n=1 Tax=Roseovarius salinarum TaxID=1981892 RepID=UPI002FCDDEA7